MMDFNYQLGSSRCLLLIIHQNNLSTLQILCFGCPLVPSSQYCFSLAVRLLTLPLNPLTVQESMLLNLASSSLLPYHSAHFAGPPCLFSWGRASQYGQEWLSFSKGQVVFWSLTGSHWGGEVSGSPLSLPCGVASVCKCVNVCWRASKPPSCLRILTKRRQRVPMRSSQAQPPEGGEGSSS